MPDVHFFATFKFVEAIDEKNLLGKYDVFRSGRAFTVRLEDVPEDSEDEEEEKARKEHSPEWDERELLVELLERYGTAYQEN